jgi:hypothetical protein
MNTEQQIELIKTARQLPNIPASVFLKLVRLELKLAQANIAWSNIGMTELLEGRIARLRHEVKQLLMVAGAGDWLLEFNGDPRGPAFVITRPSDTRSFNFCF